MVKVFTNADGISTTKWRYHQQVTPSTPPFSVVAKFTGDTDNDGRKYDGETGGHTGIIIETGSQGVVFLDQNFAHLTPHKNSLGVHFMSWGDMSTYATIKMIP